MSSKLLKCIDCKDLFHPRADVYNPIDDYTCICAGCVSYRLEKAESDLTEARAVIERVREWANLQTFSIEQAAAKESVCGLLLPTPATGKDGE